VHGADDRDENEHDHPDHALVFSTWAYTSPKAMSFNALRRLVENLPQAIYRAKGTAYIADSPESPAMLQVVGKRASLTYDSGGWGDRLPVTQIVFIGAHGAIDVPALESQLESCWAENAPKNELERLTTAALTWLRRIRQPEK